MKKILIGLLLMPLMVWADEIKIGDVTWSFTVVNDKATVTGAAPSLGVLEIPSTLNGYLVTSIGNHAFSSCYGLTSVTISEGVTSIGSFAFYNCSGLKSVTIPSSVTNIGDYAFWGCIRMTSVTISEGVTSIGDRAFGGCDGLKSVTIPEGVTSIGSGAFDGCSGLTSVTIPSSVTNVGEEAFAYCSRLMRFVVDENNQSYCSKNNLLCTSDGEVLVAGVNGDVVIPEGVTSIGNYAFYNYSGLKSVTIPSSVTNIGERAFACCGGLMRFVVDENNQSYCSKNNLLCTSDGEVLVAGVNGDVVIPEGVTSIGDWAFYGCYGLTLVTIPSSVTSIREWAFYACSGLTRVDITDLEKWCRISFGSYNANPLCYAHRLYLNGEEIKNLAIPSGVTSIGDYAFCGCSGLMSVTIPSSVTSIRDYAFDGCSGLTEVAIPSSVTSIGDGAFYGCGGLKSVTIPSSVTNLSVTFPSAYRGISEVVVCEGVTSIGDRAFYGCSGLTEITMPSSVTSIGDRAFDGCSGLKSVMMPNSVTSIGADAFSGCSGLTSVTMPPCVTRLSATFPDACTKIENVVVCDGVTSIGDYVFSGCSGLKSVTIPSSVTSIEESAFSSCGKRMTFVVDERNPSYKSDNGLLLTKDGKMLIAGVNGDVTIPSSVLNIGNGAFDGCGGLKSVTIPSSVTSIGDYVFSGCSGLKSVTIPSSVTSIRRGAFEGCRGLTSVTIPSSVTSIGELAFYNCSGLKSVTIPSSVTSIGELAFYNCSGLKSVTIPSSVTNIGDYAFYRCSHLGRIFMPWEVSVGEEAIPSATLIVHPVSVMVGGCERSFVYDGSGAKYCAMLTPDVAQYGIENIINSLPLTSADAGRYQLELTASMFQNTNESFEVEFVVDPKKNMSSVVIEPRPVTATTGSAQKVFDGMPLVCSDITVGGDGFVEGDCTVLAVGSQAVVGSSKNAVEFRWAEDASPSNYDITVKEGVLTVLPAKVDKDGDEPGEGVVPQGGLSKYDATTVYDGMGHTIDVDALMGVEPVADVPFFSYSLTSNGVYQTEPIFFTNACVTSVWYRIAATNYEDYVHEARVTILPREVTLTSGTAKKKYDGGALTNGELIVGGDGFVGDDGVTWTCAGSQTEVGSSENPFEYAFREGTLASNYSITKQYGTLTVEYAGVTDKPTIQTESFSGDEGEVVIVCEEAGDVVYYTLDGSAPTTASAVYERPIAVTASDTILRVKAIAVRKGWTPSEATEQRIVSLTPPNGSGNTVAAATAKCRTDNPAVIDIAYDVAGNSSANRQPVYVFVSVCGTNLAYVINKGFLSEFGAAGRHVVTVDFSEALLTAKGYSFEVVVGGSSLIVPNWAEGFEGLLVKDGWVYGHTDSAIRELEIPDGVVGIAAGAFAGFAQLETVSLPLTLRRICGNAFTMDTRLTSIVLPEGLEFVGDEAFYGCTKMADVIVPGTVKTVGGRAFAMCTALIHAQVAYGVESVGAGCFSNDWRISEVDLPSTVTNVGEMAFGGDSSIIRAGLRCDVRKMSEIFSNYEHLREIIVKDGDGAIVDGCFANCKELKDVRYMGNCPELENGGATLYQNTFASNGLTLVSYVMPESTGWDGIVGSDQLPQAWPLTGLYRRPIAHWDVPTYLCRFDSNGGTLGVQDTYQYSEQDVVLPPEPVQSGYRFAGWWTQPVGGLRVTEKTIFIEGVYTYLWAHWVKGHTVFLDPNGGVVINGFVTYVDESVYGVLPTPVRSGYAFDGWLYNDEKIKPDTKISEMADHTLTAQWTANQYKVQYHPNGGIGDLVVEEWVYGETNCLRRNAFVREGYVFIGWATEEGLDEVVYKDCEPVANLTTEDGAIVELWAVWQESDAVDPTNVEFSFGGAANWEKVYELVSTQMEGHVICTPSFWRSGKIADNEQSDMRTKVFGAGTVGFWWKVSSERFRQEKLDHLSFSIDGNEQMWINGETDWAYVEFRVEESGPHEFVWRYAKDGMDSAGEDNGSVCAVVWSPRLETLEDYAGTTNLTLVTGGDADWFGVTNVVRNHFGSVRSGGVGDGQSSWLESTVDGEGVIAFWWKTDCEVFHNYKLDHVSFYIDGAEQVWTNGVTDWKFCSFKVVGGGRHALVWLYEKDDEDASGEDCAWVSEINWCPSESAEPEPSVAGDPDATVTGDAEKGFVIRPSEGKTAVEVSIPGGIDAGRVTVEVSPKVASVKPNGAKVKIVNGRADITEFLNVPVADGNGVIDLTKATVKEEIVKEVMDPAKGAKIELNAANSSLTTPNTRIGLFYQLHEGTTLGGMADGDSTIGDGQPWTPKITVKGGNSAFYSIGVGKGE